MAFERIAGTADLPAGSMIELVRGEMRVAVCNVDGALHAFSGTCPHRGGPLAHGALHGSTVVCPWHAWEFDCISGAHDGNPSIRLAKYPVEERDGGIWVELP
jgi:nitrite reductase/ring-hydroxylating ferredoxin subunit